MSLAIDGFQDVLEQFDRGGAAPGSDHRCNENTHLALAFAAEQRREHIEIIVPANVRFKRGIWGKVMIMTETANGADGRDGGTALAGVRIKVLTEDTQWQPKPSSTRQKVLSVS